MKKIAFKTLGCRLNQFETDALASQFRRHGYQIVRFDDPADVVVINTCTVTNQSDSKSRQAISHAARNHEDAMLVVTGCMVNNHRETLEAPASQPAYFIDNEHKNDIFGLVDAHFKGEIVHLEHLNSNLFAYEAAEKTFHTRSWIKIQDGCNNFCTYCIIPKVRGRATSRPVSDILENIRQVVDFGYREVVLTGVNNGRYQDSGINFDDLVEKILEVPGDFRLRIGSIEPEGFGDKLFSLFGHPKLTPHLHLCLQSGSDDILRKMRRTYDTHSFLDVTGNIRKHYPDFNFTTDIIVGFPGESEKDFQDSLSLVKQIGFGHIHTFKYSVRESTRAERMPDQIPEKEKSRRSAILRNLAVEEKINYRLSLLGKDQLVLVEKVNKGLARGYGENYVPVEFQAGASQVNSFVKIKLASLGKGDDPLLCGKPI